MREQKMPRKVLAEYGCRPGKQGSEWTFPRRGHAFGTFDPLVSTHAEIHGIRGHQSGKSTLTPVFFSLTFARTPGRSPRSAPCPAGCRTPRPARSEEHTSELQSLMRISYAVFCLKKKIRRYSKYFAHTVKRTYS